MKDTQQTVLIAGSIVIGFGMVAAVLFLFPGSQPTKGTVYGDSDPTVLVGSAERAEGEPRWVYGEEDAKTTIVEFSDFQCPFCSRLHPTLKKIVDESDGKINWEYRHLPLSIHPNALPASLAAECVGKTLGNDLFWSYLDTLFKNQNLLSPDYIQTEAIKAGMDIDTYTACTASSVIADRIITDSQKAQELGGSGTPFSVIEYADGINKVVSGALPYINWKHLLNSVE